MTPEQKTLVEKDHVPEQANKPYTKPQLSIYGTVEQLTGKLGLLIGDLGIIGSGPLL